MPAGAIFVAATGSDSASGSTTAPLRTIAKAITKAQSGGTIVIRAGTYHESLLVPTGKTLTIQSYPHEAVWLDGTSAVPPFTASSGVWKAPWSAEFDSSPTFTRGAPDGTAEFWTFINPDYPMASHPDQVWIDDRAQAQVGSLAKVKPGTFYVDYATKQLYVGSNPSGKHVVASDLQTALMVVSKGSIVRGIGIRRYAPSVPDFGALSARRPNVTFENVVVRDAATIGIAAISTDTRLIHVTVLRAGMLGICANDADGLVVDHSIIDSNNAEHFNDAPVAGGIKAAHTRGVTISNDDVNDNNGIGLWFDASVYDMKVFSNDMVGNTKYGIAFEISSLATVANNVISNNGSDGLRINNTSNVNVVNNTIAANGRDQLSIVQDPRSGSRASDYGHDSRRPFPDPTMTWLVGPVRIQNNVIVGTPAASGNGLVTVRDQTNARTPAQMGIVPNGNIYNRTTSGKPAAVMVWGWHGNSPKSYPTLAAFEASTGQDKASFGLDGAPVLDASSTLIGKAASAAVTVARPLTSAIAALLGRPTSSGHVGAWR